MAKSEIPSIVVHPGTGGCSGECGSEGAMSERPRLAKQEEFEMEEENHLASSPITIHIQEEREVYCDTQGEQNACENDGHNALPSSSMGESSSASLSTECRPVEKTVPRSHGHGKGDSKQQLSKQGSSQGSIEGSSPSLSRDSSTETYTDSTGIDLHQFIVDTLHKSQKDRAMLLKIEQDLYTLVKDNKCQVFKFTPMSSYNRMLVHRVSAFFGMEHNIDKPGTSVIVNKTKNTRLPDVRFSEYIRDELVPEEPKKLILKRDSASFEEGKESPERQSSMDSRRSKSFEEREEEYEKARARIFNQDEGYGESPYSLRSQEGTLSSSRRSSQEDLRAWTGEPRPWSSTDSDSSSRKANSFENENGPVAGNSSTGTKSCEVSPKMCSESGSKGPSSGLLNPNQLLVGSSGENRPSLTKASSFGGITLLTRDTSATGKGSHSHSARLTKAESLNETSSSCKAHSSNTVQPRLVDSQGVSVIAVSSQEGTQLLSPNAGQQQKPPADMPVTFSLGAGGHQSLIENPSSQQCQWELQGASKENGLARASSDSQLGTPGVPMNSSPALWSMNSVDSIPPGSVLLNPALATSPYFGNPETMVYQTKGLSAAQAYMVTPIHTLKGPLLPPPPSASNGQPLVGSSGAHQVPPPQLGIYPGSQYGTVVYIPCVASLGQQGSTPSPATALQLITSQQQQQQQQHQQHTERRPNQAAMPDLVQQLSTLTLTPPPAPAPPTSGPCEMTPYLLPTTPVDLVAKAQPSTPTILKAQPTPCAAQVPLYYMQQGPTGGFNGVRYMCPSGPPMILQGQHVTGNNSTCYIKAPEATPTMDHSVAQSPSPHLVAQPQTMYPGYSLLSFPQQGLDSNHLNQVQSSATAASLHYSYTTAVGNGPAPSTPLVPPASSLPLFPYNNGGGLLLNSAIINSSQQQQQQIILQQQQQHYFGQPSPVLVGNNGTSHPQNHYRHLTSNVLQGVPGAPSGGTAPYLSYAIYSPQNANYNSLHSSFLHVLRPNLPPSLSGIRNSTPSSPPNMQQQQQQQSFQGVPVQFTTASTMPNHSMTSATSAPQFQRGGKVFFPAKQDLNTKEAITSAGQDVKFNRGAPRLHFANSSPSVRIPPAAPPLYRQTLPLLSDVRLLGRPLHQPQQLNQAAILLAQQQQQQQHQQRPRFPSHHQQQQQHQNQAQNQQYSLSPGVQAVGVTRVGSGTNRGTGGRKCRNRIPANKGVSSGTSLCDSRHSSMELLNRGSPLVLEVDGMPPGLRRSELDRYLEPLVGNYGAKIQVQGGDFSSQVQGGDFLLNTPCKHRVLAVFETEAAAQSALLNIKTSKFQLRSCAHSKHAKS